MPPEPATPTLRQFVHGDVKPLPLQQPSTLTPAGSYVAAPSPSFLPARVAPPTGWEAPRPSPAAALPRSRSPSVGRACGPPQGGLGVMMRTSAASLAVPQMAAAHAPVLHRSASSVAASPVPWGFRQLLIEEVEAWQKSAPPQPSSSSSTPRPGPAASYVPRQVMPTAVEPQALWQQVPTQLPAPQQQAAQPQQLQLPRPLRRPSLGRTPTPLPAQPMPAASARVRSVGRSTSPSPQPRQLQSHPGFIQVAAPRPAFGASLLHSGGGQQSAEALPTTTSSAAALPIARAVSPVRARQTIHEAAMAWGPPPAAGDAASNAANIMPAPQAFRSPGDATAPAPAMVPAMATATITAPSLGGGVLNGLIPAKVTPTAAPNLLGGAALPRRRHLSVGASSTPPALPAQGVATPPVAQSAGATPCSGKASG
eukprot:TRINITY_DN8135_c1_g1_i2.p1 TRINITY_DN8135_c1_g1~~TRINITY_DN8135_c1_g1_i2.p1  ORF type:complete len:498 (+),score=85.41 TRINITY_DN8135_c1_g1_i2:220-1494(+)